MVTTSHEFNNLTGWTIDAGDWTSTGTTAKLTNSTGRMRYTSVPPDTNNVRVTAEIDAYSVLVGNHGGPAARMSASADTLYVVVHERVSGTDQKRLYKFVAGTPTQLATSDQSTFVKGDTHGVECDGTSIRGRFKGSQWTSITDSGIASGGWGLRAFASSTSARFWEWERWEANDLAAATPIPVLQHNYRRRRVP